MNVTVLTPPPFEPLSLADLYAHLRLDPEGSPATHPDDEWLEATLKHNRAYAESVTRRSFIRQTLRLTTARFGTRIPLLRPPVAEVLAVSYWDAENALQTLDPASYYLADDLVPELRFPTAWAPPELYDRPDAVRVDYIAGYAPDGSPPASQAEYAAHVPFEVKAALKLLVGDAYENRLAGTAAKLRDPSGAVEALLSTCRVLIV